MAIALKVDTSTGRLAQLLVADVLDIDQIEGRSAGNLVIGANSIASEEVRLSVSGEVTRTMGDLVVDENATISGNATIVGDLLVQGTTTSVDSEVVLVADNHLYLNAGYTADAAQTGGLVVNYDPTTTNDTVAAGGFTAATTVATTAAGPVFSVGDFVQISGANNHANNGLYEVVSHGSNVLTIDATPVEDFVQTGFTADSTVAGTITHVNVSILRAGTDGLWETAVGNNNGLTFNNLSVGATDTLQSTYEAGNTVDVTTAQGIIDFANDTNTDTTTVLSVSRTPGSSTAGLGLDVSLGANTTGTAVQINQAGSGLGLDVQDGGGSVLQTTGAGAVSITPTSGQNATITAAGAGVVDVDAAGAITLDSSGAGISLDAAGASNFATSSGALTLTGAATSTWSLSAGDLTLDAAAGELTFDDTGGIGIELSDSSNRALAPAAAGELFNGVTSIVGAFNAIGSAIDVDGQAGIKDYVIESGVTIAAGDTVAQGSTSGRITEGDADTAASVKQQFVGIALEGGTGTGGSVFIRVALPGNFVAVSGAAFTAGDALFLPDGGGIPVSTAPSGTGDVVMRVGWAHSATEMVVDPGPAIIL